MSGRAVQVALILLLCSAALSAWACLNGRARGRRRSRAVLVGAGAAHSDTEGRGRVHGLGRPVHPPGARRPRWVVVELAWIPVGLALWQLWGSPVPALAAVLLVFPLHGYRARRRVAREARSRAVAITELCAALAGELRSGATPDQALDSIAGRGRSSGGLDSRLGEEAVVRLAAGRYGADVPAAFRWLAQLPGGGGAAAIAACWQVTADSGTGLATGLDRVAEALRAERALEDEIRGELAGPRTTAGLLAALPVFGLLLGGALGAHPVTILLHTPLGLGCLSAGAVLEAVGLVWTARIVRGAQYLAGAGAGAGEGEGGELGASREPACGAGRGGGVGDGAARSAHSSHARHARPSRCTARTWWTGRAGRVAAARAEVAW